MLIILLISTLFQYINLPVIDMRVGPSDTTKVDSQAIYAEPVTILEEQGEWVKIQTLDSYDGWVKKNAIIQSEHKYCGDSTGIIAVVNRSAAHLYHVQDTEYGPIKTVPFETHLEVIDQFGDPNGRWLQVRLVDGSLAYIQRGDVTFDLKPLNREEMVKLSRQFLGLPYTWGGKSSFGYDCSGFAQMLYRQMGITIPRNSRTQAAWAGFKEIPLEAMQPGDLIFFAKKDLPIGHMGIYVGNGEFIHATVAENKPYIRYSNLNLPPWDGSGPFAIRTGRTLKDPL